MTTASRTRLTHLRPPPSFPLRRWTVEQYHELIGKDVLTPDDKIELLDGWIVDKMPQQPLHASTTQRLDEWFKTHLPANWRCRCQLPITLRTSEPEPDIAIVHGSLKAFEDRHPGPLETRIVIEVSRSSLRKDTIEKARIYAEAGIPAYWVVDVTRGVIEVLTDPTGGRKAHYRSQKAFRRNGSIPVVLSGKKLADLPVRETLR